MEKLDIILNQLEGIEERLSKLENEGKDKRKERREGSHRCTITPSEMPMGLFAYVGRYNSKDETFGSTFGADSNTISSLFKINSFEMAKVIDAFASEERLDIIKNLMQERLTIKVLMENLQYQTTGKLYHHLSYLDKIGVITKENDQYFVTPKYISAVVLILTGAEKLTRIME
ncbi:MAG: hypothetical protein HFI85_06075 [Clostridia bacterium]|jgi:DNA-binding HxlR family transcriptional regulator|nr:hypothetical protein [Clostridia bacterium]